MGDKICPSCGGEGADRMCKKCGAIVCGECFDEETGLCVDCVEELVNTKVRNKRLTLFGGILLMLLGISVMASGIILGLPAAGITIVFPFVVGEVSPTVAAGYSFLFFLAVISASLIPWYVHSMMEEYGSYDEDMDGVMIQEGKMQSGESTVDYVITTEVPKKLVKTIVVETSVRGVSLRSTADRGFSRSYNLPQGFNLEGLDYDYDGGYLVLNLRLGREG